ncbi:hypothetical protein U3516DRAFT_751300 [Neocallimastix sp. 'constans']
MKKDYNNIEKKFLNNILAGNIIFIREILIDFKPTNMTMERNSTIIIEYTKHTSHSIVYKLSYINRKTKFVAVY